MAAPSTSTAGADSIHELIRQVQDLQHRVFVLDRSLTQAR